jgi:hypothetical protein
VSVEFEVAARLLSPEGAIVGLSYAPPCTTRPDDIAGGHPALHHRA